MKTKYLIIVASMLILGQKIIFSQVAQFPQVYYNGQGSGGANIYIHQSASYGSTNLTLLSTTSNIGAVGLTTNSSDPYFMNWVQVCLPSTSGSISYGYIACDEFYARINEVNNYATVTATSLNIRPTAGSSSWVTISGSNAMFGQNSIVALTGNTTVVGGTTWYEIHLPMNCSQYTGWVSGTYLTINSSTTNYRIEGGRITDTPGNCAYLGNINEATVHLGSLATTYSSGGFFQYKVPTNWSGNITCTHPSYTTSTPSSYSVVASSHDYSNCFVLSNSSCTAPTMQATTINFSGVSSNQITLDWSDGDGTNRIVVVRASSSITSSPTNGSTYTASSSFGSGSTIGTGQYVVYNGTGSSVTVTGLTANTTYYFKVFEYSCNPTQYLTSSATGNPSSQITSGSCTAPTSQASNISFSGVSTNQMNLNWSDGDGTNRIVVARASSSITSSPTNGSTYTASSSFGSGSTIGTGQYVVYNGTGSSLTLTGLTANTTYYFKVFEYSCNPTQYLTSSATGNPSNQITSSSCTAPTSQASSITFSGISTNQMNLNWSDGNGTNRIVVARSSSSITSSPTNGSTYTASSTFGSGSTIGTGQYVVYNGTGSSVTVTGLTANTTYHFKVFEYSCNPTQYLTSSASGNPSSQTTLNSSTYSISGTVINPTISDFTGAIQNNPLSCNVKIFTAGTSNPVGSTTSSGGNFSFSGLQNQDYDLLASYTSNSILYTVKILNIPANSTNVQLKLSAGLIEAIDAYNITLSNLECYLDDLGQAVPVASYNMLSSNNYITSHEQIVNNQDEVIESLERLCLAERLLVKYYDQASSTNNQFILSQSAFAEYVFDLLKVGVCAGSIIEVLTDVYVDFAEYAMESTLDNSNVPYSNDYEILFHVATDYLRGEVSMGSVYSAFKPFIDLQATNLNLNNVYRVNTSNLVNYSVIEAQNGNFTGSIQTAISNINSQLTTSNVATAYSNGLAEGYRENPWWVQSLYYVGNLGMSCLPNPYTYLLGISLNEIHFYFLQMAVLESVTRENELVYEANTTLPNSFQKIDHGEWNNFDMPLQSSKHLSTNNIISNFENEYSNTLADINANNISTLNTHLNNLVTLNKKLNDSLIEEVNSIRAAIPFSSLTDSMCTVALKYTLYAAPYVRFAHLASIAGYIQTLNDTLRDSLNYYSSDIFKSDSIMLSELANIESFLLSVQSPGYIAINNSDIPLFMSPNSDSNVVVKFKNYGATSATNLYAKIEFESLFVPSVDSILIGTLNPNQMDSLSFTIHSPTIDTLSSFSIKFFADDAITKPHGGVIFSKIHIPSNNEQIESANINFQLMPNPANNHIIIDYSAYSSGSKTELQFFSIEGKLLKSLPLQQSKTEINISEFSNGVYILKLSNDEGTAIRRLIIE